jgi:hypothetical protein
MCRRGLNRYLGESFVPRWQQERIQQRNQVGDIVPPSQKCDRRRNTVPPGQSLHHSAVRTIAYHHQPDRMALLQQLPGNSERHILSFVMNLDSSHHTQQKAGRKALRRA